MQLQDTPHPKNIKAGAAECGCWQCSRSRRAGGRGARSAPPAPSASPRLGSSTHFDTYADAVKGYAGPSYLGILKGYGPNGAKLILRTIHERPEYGSATGEREEKEEKRKETGVPRSMVDPVDVEKSAWRARSNLEDWVRMVAQPGMDIRLGTGTARYGIATLADAHAATAKMRRQVERHYPGVRILAVPELHHGGGVNDSTFHVHMLLVFQPGQKPNFSIFHRLWYKALGGTGKEKGADAPGNFDFARTHGKDGKRYTACQGARYLSKYVTKDLFAGNVGQKRFTTSHGAPEPIKRYWWQPIAKSYNLTRAHAVSLLREFFPADKFMILCRTFNDGGDTFHVFSAEPAPS
jgi:hypothetical protein